MEHIARSSPGDRADLFQEAASRRPGLSAAIMEKDFWVCWCLKRIFSAGLPLHLLFKGGTSLSKSFHAIERFSEDVDLSFDRKELGLELGARSDSWPSGMYAVTPYAAEVLPTAFAVASCQVNTLEAVRTFWEKVTLLHAECHRPDPGTKAERTSRHYYDLYQLFRHPIGESALRQLDLLARVVAHKQVFFRSGWANYQTARPGSLRLVPPETRVAALRADYAEMQGMIFGPVPTWDEVLDSLRALELRVNSGSSTPATGNAARRQ
ncbi:MAG: hypothetical protein A3K19_19725 [Lentisphaerae bacterium RIFOXYB12_FULL_65_16]|nr:MAG: hypothetical protein A3K18_31090 [Lentisphaerae bacterium RIFOXYA12_64_32]OGV92091.1 MAG: hypothetical protein A3K19_19725 [Lentisphaerae bacterium RIFOXYB12_FULL_65_16]